MVAQVAMEKMAKTEPQVFQAPQEPQDRQALQVLQVVAEEVLQHHLQHQVRALAKEHFVWVRATPQSPLH
jgi:H2-forming N5,N10-methylenetetrahydromethanopterin dehydrogenase-like enzyme